MKWILVLLIFIVYASSGCDYRKREEELQKKETALNQKEQELLLKEKTLQLKEEDLAKREQRLDSTIIDSTHVINPALTGIWSVQMSCTEATCTGFAIGDTKSEQWQISYTGNTLIAKAFSNNQLARVYTGFDTGNTIELVEDRDTTVPNVKMVVRLRFVDTTHMEGQREIAREDCKVIYDLKLEKNNS